MKNIWIIGMGVLIVGLTGVGGASYYILERPLPVVESTQDPKAFSGVVNSIGMKLTLIPAGKFVMGSPEMEIHRNGDESEHEVFITKPFHLGIHEVTQGQYAKIMGENPSFFSAKGGASSASMGRTRRTIPWSACRGMMPSTFAKS